MSEKMTGLLLVGRSGHGKSSTGNSILGEKVFKPKFNVTEDSERDDGVIEETRKVGDIEVQVVDATGLADNDEEFPENAEHFIDLANKAMDKVPETGYSAIVLVLKYGIRFTKQEMLAVKMIKSLFGPEVIKHHGIIVMTCGDQFERDMEDERLDFHQWCGQQEGEVKRLMKECGQCCVLFDNKTKGPECQRQQVQQLMGMVEQVRGRARPYTRTNFQDAERGRKKLLVMAKAAQLEQKMNTFLSGLNKQELTSPQDCDRMLRKLEEFETQLKKEDEDMICLEHLMKKLDLPKERVKMQREALRSQEAMPTSPTDSITAVGLAHFEAAETQTVDKHKKKDGRHGFVYRFSCGILGNKKKHSTKKGKKRDRK